MKDKTSQPYYSLIIPAFNEEARIGKSLDRIMSFLQSQSYSSEVIIVDDDSQIGQVTWSGSGSGSIPE